MECAEYIENHLSAHADGELTADEEREVSAHLEGCANCRAALEEERELKRLLKARAQAVRAPEHIRAKLVASLDAAGRRASRRRAPSASVWLPLAIAAG